MTPFPYQNHPLRLAALDAGEDRFLMQYPCKNGHVAPRYVSNGQCIQCRGGALSPRKPKKSAQDIVQSHRRNELQAQERREALGGTRDRHHALRGLGTAMGSDDARRRSEYIDKKIRNASGLE
jgi:hypothetical protein